MLCTRATEDAEARRARGGVDPLKPIVETRPAAHIAPIVRLRSRLGVSQVKLWVCSQDLNPVAAEAAAIAQPAHISSA